MIVEPSPVIGFLRSIPSAVLAIGFTFFYLLLLLIFFFYYLFFIIYYIEYLIINMHNVYKIVWYLIVFFSFKFPIIVY